MSYTDKELIEHVNAQIVQDEEYHRQTLECLEIKKEVFVRQLVQKVAKDHGITLSDVELGQIVQECLLQIKAQELHSSIIVREIQLGGQG